ncbi:hypothetical protein UO65_3622 [Actinokineospora spheciospongiae]|uniref:Uncharacterized protein n=1 Tax=Actinokineospora spheciospongiae TaxID=909613 RepID=W7IX78_9PSEU|nr:hypothetical protein UO65_3622 [Actinokineospora spheciospongiae]
MIRGRGHAGLSAVGTGVSAGAPRANTGCPRGRAPQPVKRHRTT